MNYGKVLQNGQEEQGTDDWHNPYNPSDQRMEFCSTDGTSEACSNTYANEKGLVNWTPVEFTWVTGCLHLKRHKGIWVQSQTFIANEKHLIKDGERCEKNPGCLLSLYGRTCLETFKICFQEVSGIRRSCYILAKLLLLIIVNQTKVNQLWNQ